MMNWANEAQLFLERLLNDFNARSLYLEDHWQIDHLCFRVDTEKSYQLYKEYFLTEGILLIESMIGGRLISTFKMTSPIKYKNWSIDLIELPAPKTGTNHENGFEHIEVVCDVSFSEIQDWLSKEKLELKGLSKIFNPDIELILNDGSIKFHHQSLESVITLEKSRVFETIKRSELLSRLKEFSPLVVGTFPLGVETDKSDIDIVIELNQNDEIFKLENDQHYQTWSLNYEGVEFEIYGQREESVKQNGFMHFNLEERMLKIGGKKFLQKIKALRVKGLKTEDSFCQAIGVVSDDPYQELLKYYYLDELELSKLIKESSND